MDDIKITKLAKDFLIDFRKIKLESLKKEPLAFDSSYEEMNKWSEDKWNNYLKRLLNAKKQFVLLAYNKSKVCGFSVLEFNEKKKKHHIADLLSLYVSEKYRRKGIARSLLDLIIKFAEELNPDLKKIELYVYSSQTEAIRFYEDSGFEIVGVSKKGLFYEGKYYDQVLMDKFLI